MKAFHSASGHRQGGFVSVLAAIILIAAVMFVLGQSYGIIGNTSDANVSQSDSVAALFVAESGLLRGEKLIAAMNPITNKTCSTTDNIDFAGTTQYPVGTETGAPYFTLSATCTSVTTSVTVPCLTCLITSTGTKGSASRIVQRAITVENREGVTCNGATATPDCSNLTANLDAEPPVLPTWSMSLTNPSDTFDSIALFHLAATSQGGASTSDCTIADCSMEWRLNSKPSGTSVTSMGNIYSIGAGKTSPTIYQTVEHTGANKEDVAQTGVFFPGTKQPTLVGAYWNDQQNGDGTKGSTNTTTQTGLTNNGAMTTTGTCSGPYTATSQACTKWCYDGDIMIFALAGNSGVAGSPPSGTTDILSDVRFNNQVSGSGNNLTIIKNIPLTGPVSHFPDASTPNAPLTVFSEIWYKRNLSYFYGAKITEATITNDVPGATFQATTDVNYPSKLNVTSCSVGWLEIGDTITAGEGISPGTKVTGLPSGSDATGCPAGLYTVDTAVTTNTSTANRTSTRTVLNVSGIDGGEIVVGQTLSGTISGTSITGNSVVATGTGIGTNGTYYLNAATAASPLSFTASITVKPITAGATSQGAVISVPNAAALPSIGTILAVRSGVGEFAAGTSTEPAYLKATVLDHAGNSNGKQFTIGLSPGTPLATNLNGAQICGGTCAFFEHDNAYTYIGTANNLSGAPNTLFSFTKPANLGSWASGFTCLKGVNVDPASIQKPIVRVGSWREVVR